LHVLGKAGAHVYFDENGDIKIYDFNVNNLISSYCTHPDFSDARHLGYVKEMEMSELRALAINKGLEIGDRQWFDIATQYSGKMNNRQFTQRSFNEESFSWDQVSDMKVLVMFLEIKTSDSKVYRMKESKKGKGLFYDKMPDTYDQEPSSENKVLVVDRKEVEEIYEGWYICDTDMIFGYGKRPNTSRKRVGDTYSTSCEFNTIVYAPHMLNMQNKSMVEIMNSYAEELINIELKMQQLIRKSRPSGVAIDTAQLQGITKGMGMGFLSIDDIEDIFDQVGNLYYRGVTANGAPILGANAPVTPLPGGLQGQIREYIDLHNYYMGMLYRVSGQNETIDGSGVTKNVLAGVEENRIEAYNNATKFITDGYVNIMERVANRIFSMSQQQMRMGVGVKGYKRGIGKSRSVIISDQNYTLKQVGIKLQFRPQGAEVDKFRATVDHMLKTDSIAPEVGSMAASLATVSIKQADEYLTRKAKMYREEKHRQAMELSASQAQEAAQSGIAVKQAEVEGKAQMIEMEKALYTHRVNEDIRKAQEIFEKVEKEKMQLDGEFKQDLLITSANIDAETELLNNPPDGVQTNMPSTAADHLQGSAGAKPAGAETQTGVPRPVSAPRTGVEPGDDVQQGLQAAQQ
jgi:hypothetical protein